MRKNSLIAILLLTLSVMSMQAITSNTGPSELNDYEQKSDAKSSVKLEFELGTQIGYDFETGQFGTKEIVDLDFNYIFNPFGIYKSDLSGIEYGDVYGIVEVWGAEVDMKIYDQGGDKADNPDSLFSINYENIYGKIVFDPYYLMIASARKGNHYTRNNGWTFAKSTVRTQADIAHIPYDIPWSGTVNTAIWETTGQSNALNNYGTESALGLGMIFGMTEMMIQVGTPVDWEDNEDDKFDVGFLLESNPVGNLIVKTQAFKSFNDETDENLYFALGTGYYQDLTEDYFIQPFIAFDGQYDLADDTADSERFKSETSLGLSFRWNGASGWGYEPLNDTNSNRFSGITVGANMLTDPGKDPKFCLVVTSFEETDAGLIPNLGYSLVAEMADLTDIKDRGFMKTSIGLYLDYNIMDMVKPYVRTIQTASKIDNVDFEFECGIEYTAIPNTIITVSYETDDITELEDNKGLLVTEIKVVL